MTHGWHAGATVTSTCARCSNQLGDTPHAVLEQLEASTFRVACNVCGHRHQDQIIGPQPGPQTDFVNSTADIVLYGGARGGGKSWALEMIALLFCDIPGWTGLILRRELGDITKAGGLWDKAQRCYAGTGADFKQTPNHHVTWPSGAKLEFGYLGDRNIRAYQGQEYAYIGVDEATHFDIGDLMWMATCNRSACGAPSFMRWTCNPDPDHPLREFVGPWVLPDGTADRSRSGELRFFAMDQEGARAWGSSVSEVVELSGRPRDEVYSFAYVPALVADNQILLEADPTYVGKLSLSGPIVERQHRHGDWNARAVSRGLLRQLLAQTVTEPLAPLIASSARGWDMAGTECTGSNDPDFTAGAKVLRDIKGNSYFAGLAVCRKEPPDVLALMRSTATLDGPMVTQGVYRDPAQAGKGYALIIAAHLQKSARCGPTHIEPPGSKLDQKILNANPVALALRQGTFYLLAGPWLEEPYDDGGPAANTILGLISSQVSSFPSPKARDHDDIIDAIALAYKLSASTHVVVGSPRQTAQDAQAQARARRPELHGGRRGGYGGRR